MKENKFILACVVCVIVVCKFWGLFTAPDIDIIITSDVSVIDATGKGASSDTSVKNADTDVQVNVVKADADKKTTVQSDSGTKKSDIEQNNIVVVDAKHEPQPRNFIGCGSSFSSEKTTKKANGETQKQYSAKNIITCSCDMDGSIVEKTVMYRYSAEPKKVDLDCNSKCGAICAQD